jgi:uncharacterized protein
VETYRPHCTGRILFTVALALTAARGEAQVRSAVRSLQEIRQANVVVQKWDISCGAAALATLLTYQHGDPVSEREVARAMLGKTDPLRVKVRGGFSLLDLKRFAESRNLIGEGYTEVSFADLEELGPAIVPLNLDGFAHFVVFRGRAAERALLADPAFGNRSVAVAEFERAWQGNMAFVIKRKDGRPPPNRLAEETQDRLVVSAPAIRAAVVR